MHSEQENDHSLHCIATSHNPRLCVKFWKVSSFTARRKCFSAADPIDRSCSVLRVNVGEEAIGNVLRTLSDCSAETTAHCVAAAEVVPRLNGWLLYLLQWASQWVTLMTLRKRDGEVCMRVYHAAAVDVTSFTRCCNGVFLSFESSHLSRLNFRYTCMLSRTRW